MTGHLAVGAISQKDMDELPRPARATARNWPPGRRKIQGVNTSATLRQLDERVWKVVCAPTAA